MFYFGIDWSEAHHHLCILNEAGTRVSQLCLPHSPAGFQRLEAERQKLGVPPQECLVAIETAYNPIVDFLLDQGYGVYIIPPQATNSYRNRQRRSGAYNDASDAALLASILRTDRESHRRWYPNTPLTQQMHAQVRFIESLRRSIHRQQSQLRALLLRTFPVALELFSGLTAQLTLQFLQAYPTAAEAQALSWEAFEAFCRAQGYTRPKLLRRHYATLHTPCPPIDPHVIQAHRDVIRELAQILLLQVRTRARAIAQLQRLFQQHPDAFIFASLPGAGKLLAPALLVKFGDHRQRFPRPADVQALAGTCPVTQRSGKKKRVKFRRGCDKEFRRIAHQFARASIAESGWAAAYWQEIRPHCKSDAHATRILANRWLAIIWKLWQTRQPYDEAYHVQNRARRRQPKGAI